MTVFFIDFMALLVYHCVNENKLTYLYNIDYGIIFQKAYANFYFLKMQAYLLSWYCISRSSVTSEMFKTNHGQICDDKFICMYKMLKTDYND